MNRRKFLGFSAASILASKLPPEKVLGAAPLLPKIGDSIPHPVSHIQSIDFGQATGGTFEIVLANGERSTFPISATVEQINEWLGTVDSTMVVDPGEEYEWLTEPRELTYDDR